MSVKGCKNPCACNKEERKIQIDHLEPSLTDLILNPKSKKIARPPNAFMLFARDHRKSLAMKYPKQNNKNISSLLGECWRNVDGPTKAEYYKKAKMLEELHKQKYPGYVYSPRIARMQKMAKKKNVKCNKKNADKCDDNNIPDEDEVPLESIQPRNICNHGNEKCDEWTDSNPEKKQPSPGYIPNNPQFFPNPEHIPQPELPCTAENSPPSATREVYSYPSCPPPSAAPEGYVRSNCPSPSWDMPPVEPISMPCTARCSDECRVRADMYTENYYPESIHSEMHDYGPWTRYPDYPYGPPVKSTWSSCTAGCKGDFSPIHVNDEHISYSHLTPPQQSGLKNSYYHYNSPAPYRNSPYSYTYRPFRDTPRPFRSRCCMPYKMPPPKTHSSYFSKTMDYYRNQYQHHFKDYYPKHPCAAPPMEFSPIEEGACSSDCPRQVYDSRKVAQIEERTNDIDASRGSDPQYQDAEHIKAESDDNEMINVVDEEREEIDVHTEEVVEATDSEYGQVVQDVIDM